MGTGRRGPGAYRPPKDMWSLHKDKAYWAAAVLAALVFALWLADAGMKTDE